MGTGKLTIFKNSTPIPPHYTVTAMDTTLHYTTLHYTWVSLLCQCYQYTVLASLAL